MPGVRPGTAGVTGLPLRPRTIGDVAWIEVLVRARRGAGNAIQCAAMPELAAPFGPVPAASRTFTRAKAAAGGTAGIPAWIARRTTCAGAGLISPKARNASMIT